MAYETVTYERRGPVGLLTLDRPDQLNAIDTRMVDEIGAALDEAEADDAVRVVVLAGAGRAFCAGFDLKQPGSEKDKGVAEWRALLTRDFDMIIRFWEFPKPTIAAVHGHAIAGGFEMALSCDITIADESTMLGAPELRFGAGIVALVLPWMAGPKQTKELLFTGNDKVPARRALDMGIVNAVVPDGERLDAALAMARDIAVMDPAKLALVKLAVNRTYDRMGMRDALRASLDIDVLLQSLDTPDSRAFKEIIRRDGLKAALKWRDGRFDGEGE